LFGETVPNWTKAAGYEAFWLTLRFGLTLALAYLNSLWVGGPLRRLAGPSLGGRVRADPPGILDSAEKPPDERKSLQRAYQPLTFSQARFMSLMSR